MKPRLLNTARLSFPFVAALAALLLPQAHAQTSFTSTALTGAWNSSKWNNTAELEPYTSAFTENNAVNFTAGGSPSAEISLLATRPTMER